MRLLSLAVDHTSCLLLSSLHREIGIGRSRGSDRAVLLQLPNQQYCGCSVWGDFIRCYLMEIINLVICFVSCLSYLSIHRVVGLNV